MDGFGVLTGSVGRPMAAVSTVVHAPPERVWELLADVGSHHTWMTDAESIRILPGPERGVGTVIDVVTRLGPLRTVDRMRFTIWDPPRRLGVEHIGAVRGSGIFEVRDHPDGSEVVWSESLVFPWWFAGRLGARVAAPILARVWAGNLARLRELVEAR